MKLIHSAIALLAAICCPAAIQAQSFFDTSESDRLFSLGVRAGVNTSNRTMERDVFDIWNENSWGTGFSAGVTCDLWLRNYISIQPGIFFESRSGKFAYICDWNKGNSGNSTVQVGKMRNYNITIPVLAALHFNVAPAVKWHVEMGPFVSFRLKTSGDVVLIPGDTYVGNNLEFEVAQQRKVNAGIKVGTGLTLLSHYYIGVHYTAAMMSPWSTSGLHGRDKAWNFTVGYDF